MKKIIALVFSIVLILSLTACGANGNTGGNNQDAVQSSTGSTVSQESQQTQSGNDSGVISSSESAIPSENQSSAPSSNAQSQNNTVSSKITKDDALGIALKHAGTAKDKISRLEQKYEIDDGIPQYEIEFNVGNIEYSYEINAQTGAIIDRDKDIDD